jgi:hypothetical protein
LRVAGRYAICFVGYLSLMRTSTSFFKPETALQVVILFLVAILFSFMKSLSVVFFCGMLCVSQDEVTLLNE